MEGNFCRVLYGSLPSLIRVIESITRRVLYEYESCNIAGNKDISNHHQSHQIIISCHVLPSSTSFDMVFLLAIIIGKEESSSHSARDYIAPFEDLLQLVIQCSIMCYVATLSTNFQKACFKSEKKVLRNHHGPSSTRMKKSSHEIIQNQLLYFFIAR